MIICENEPAELPKDVVRSDTKLDDGIDKLNLNLNNILKKFERGSSGDDSQPSSASSVVIEKPSFDIKKTLMAFETNAIVRPVDNDDDERADGDKVPASGAQEKKPERRVVKKLTNLNGFLNLQNGIDENELKSGVSDANSVKPLAVRRSESLMMRLKKYESRINGEQVANGDSEEEQEDCPRRSEAEIGAGTEIKSSRLVPKKLTSLKNQWENGDITRRQSAEGNVDEEQNDGEKSNRRSLGCVCLRGLGRSATSCF